MPGDPHVGGFPPRRAHCFKKKEQKKQLDEFCCNVQVYEVQKCGNVVDLVKSFPVSPHVPFLNLLFEQIANSNEYLLAKFGSDTAENEP